jgi:hypothetical protein
MTLYDKVTGGGTLLFLVGLIITKLTAPPTARTPKAPSLLADYPYSWWDIFWNKPRGCCNKFHAPRDIGMEYAKRDAVVWTLRFVGGGVIVACLLWGLLSMFGIHLGWFWGGLAFAAVVILTAISDLFELLARAH